MSTILTQPTPEQIKVMDHPQYGSKDILSPTAVDPSPLAQFQTWFKDAVANSSVKEPEVISLSTATKAGIPSARMVLFKQLDAKGFVFFTNYTSRKSRELEENPNAALVFYWGEIHRSVRVLGQVEKVTRAESEAYYNSRPIGSRLGAWASKQSTVVQEEEVAQRLQKYEDRFGVQASAKEGNVPLPDFWGGWRVIPNEIEFWSGKPSRLHDRVRYLRTEGSSEEHPKWQIERLAP